MWGVGGATGLWVKGQRVSGVGGCIDSLGVVRSGSEQQKCLNSSRDILGVSGVTGTCSSSGVMGTSWC